jgi:hydroxymethylglutaryl-CoA lyase
VQAIKMDKVSLREVGLRDGLQSLSAILPTQHKLQWLMAEVDCGVGEIEVTSMVRPDLVPQLSDCETIVRAAATIANLVTAVLVPNLKGAQRALTCGAHKLNFVMSVSETHNLRNVRATHDQSLAAFQSIKALGEGPILCGGLSTAFGCTLEGKIAPRAVAKLAEALVRLGATEIILADTVGFADPASTKEVVKEVQLAIGEAVPIALHFHDTRGLGLANISVALECDVRAFDASLGGLGGCPFAPNATGNVVMEDVVFLCEALGLSTGIDVNALLGIRKTLESWLPDVPFYGAYARAGARLGYNI